MILLLMGGMLSGVRSQSPPMGWGKIKASDLGKTAFPADTGATAVILCEYGESSIDGSLNLVFQYHARIRILSPAGYSWGSHAVDVNEESGIESIEAVQGVTYRLNSDSAVVSQEMGNDAIFKEQVAGERMRYRFTLPSLTPGCIIEFRYTVRSKAWGLVRAWSFQTSEPVLWSEYRLRYPRQIGYVAVNSGYEPFIVHTQTVAHELAGLEAAKVLGASSMDVVTMRWAVANAPAIRDEPFITTLKDYRTRVDVQLGGLALPGAGVRRILQDWGSLAEELAKEKSFGGSVDMTSQVKTLTERLTAGITDEVEKVRAVYNWVDTAIVYTGAGWSITDVDDVIEKKRGNTTEVMTLFLSLLKSAGIDGELVLASSRTHGLIQDRYPIVSQFDEVLTRVRAGSRVLFLAPTDPLRPMELLPVDLYNVRGLVIRQGGAEWVTLTSDRQSIRRTMANVQIKEDGSVDGWLDGQQSDYAALHMRRYAEDKSAHDVAMKFFDLEEAEATIDSVVIEGWTENAKPFRVRAHVSALSAVSRVGDRIYVMPMLINRTKENPFTHERRKFPVDFAYPWQQTTVVNLQLPTGYAVVDSVPERTITVGNGDMLLQRRLQSDNGVVQMNMQFDARKARFDPRVYKELRDFYGKAVGIQSEQIALQRPEQPPGPMSPPARSKKPMKR